jgi:acyl-CoA thioesterase-1
MAEAGPISALDRGAAGAHVIAMTAALSRRQLLALAASLALPTRAALAAPVKLLAYGDSLIHGYGLGPAEVFPAQLERALRQAGREVTVINGGNSGDTTAAGLARVDWTLAERPDAVLLLLGANDFLRGIDPKETAANLRALLRRFQAEGLPVLLAGMLAPRNLGADYAAEFDAIYPALAAEFDALLYPFFLEGVALDPALNQPDGIHPNAAGVAVIVGRILPAVEALLERAATAPS